MELRYLFKKIHFKQYYNGIFQIHGQEGRAGMAAILDTENTVDLKALSDGVKKCLPAYARPIFIRILHKLDMTGNDHVLHISHNARNEYFAHYWMYITPGTYKMKKLDLQKDGFNPSVIKDSLYYFNNGEYSLLTKDAYEQINTGKIRL